MLVEGMEGGKREELRIEGWKGNSGRRDRGTHVGEG